MKIVVDKDIPYIGGRFPKDVTVVSKGGSEIGAEDVRDADALVVRTRTKVNEELLKDSNVRLVVTATIGTDHIEMEWCEANGIKVMNAPGCNAPGVAQYVFASLFKTGFDPKINVLGIVGYGNVGGVVANWAKDMGIETLISDLPREKAGHRDVEYLPLEEVISKSDAVTVHVPLTKTGPYPTYRLIDEKLMSMMKPSVVLVNSSRGGVVEEKSLKGFLRDGSIRGIIDVWEGEPEIDAELAELTKIATPHIAGYSLQGKMRATRMALEALKQELGIEVDLKGLETLDPSEIHVTEDRILASYDPMADTMALKSNLSSFESLRNNYSYRSEPS